MNGVLVTIRQRGRGQVSGAMTVWAILTAAVLFCLEARVGRASVVGGLGVVITVLFGALLGWRRRVPAVFVAPFVSWLWAWLPLWIAAVVEHGVLGGLAIGFFLLTLGWVGIGLIEVVILGVVALLVRSLRGPNEHDIVVFGPDGRP